MYTISVRFKDKNKVFKGRTYDFRVNPNEEKPRAGMIIRMFDKNDMPVCNATRVRIENVRKTTELDSKLSEICYIETDLNS